MASIAEEIAIKLGVKTGDLKAALTDAGASIKKLKKDSEDGGDGFEKSFKKAKQSIEIFKSVLAGAGLVGILKNIFQTAIDYAEKYEGAFDADVAATLRVRDAQKDLEKTIGKITAAVVGIADKFGTAVGSLVYGVDAASDALNQMDAEAKKAFDAERVKKLKEETDKLAKVRHDAALAAADENGKINILAADYVKLLQEQTALKKGSIEWIQKTVEVESKAAELRKQDAETRKKEEEERKKELEDVKKEEDDLANRRALAIKDETELYELQRKSTESLTAEEKKRKAELEAQKIELIRQVEIEDLMKKKITGDLTPAEAARLDELLKQEKKLKDQQAAKAKLAEQTKNEQLQAEQLVTSEMEEQIRREQIITEEKRRQAQIAASMHVGVEQTGDVRNIDDVQLDQVIQNVSKQIAYLKATQGVQPPGYTDPQVLILQNALFNAQKERDLRRDFVNTERTLGDDYAKRNFAPDEYNRLLQLFNPDRAKKDSDNLNLIATGLSNTFPSQFNR